MIHGQFDRLPANECAETMDSSRSDDIHVPSVFSSTHLNHSSTHLRLSHWPFSPGTEPSQLVLQSSGFRTGIRYSGRRFRHYHQVLCRRSWYFSVQAFALVFDTVGDASGIFTKIEPSQLVVAGAPLHTQPGSHLGPCLWYFQPILPWTRTCRLCQHAPWVRNEASSCL